MFRLDRVLLNIEFSKIFILIIMVCISISIDLRIFALCIAFCFLAGGVLREIRVRNSKNRSVRLPHRVNLELDKEIEDGAKRSFVEQDSPLRTERWAMQMGYVGFCVMVLQLAILVFLVS